MIDEKYDVKLPYAQIEIEPGLLLSQLQPSEAARLFDLVDTNREYLQRWLPFVKTTNSPDDSRNFIASTIEKRRNGAEYSYGIDAGKQLVGHISLIHLNDGDTPEIGYWIASNESGKGVMTKAVSALTRFGLETLELDKIILQIDHDNIASNKVASKAGYMLDGRIQNEKGRGLNVWIAVKS